ncbi:MAG: rhodanese-like domain-containing protein [Rubrobacteraceae bacterium]
MEWIKVIDRDGLKAKIEDGEDFVLLEVLGEESYRKGHLPGAVRFQDVSLASEVIPDKDTVVVAYCSNFT